MARTLCGLIRVSQKSRLEGKITINRARLISISGKSQRPLEYKFIDNSRAALLVDQKSSLQRPIGSRQHFNMHLPCLLLYLLVTIVSESAAHEQSFNSTIDTGSNNRNLDACVHNYDDLRQALLNSSQISAANVVLCEGIINIEDTIYVTKVINLSITCAGTTLGSCILSKTEGKPGRILYLQGNGVLINGITFQNGSTDYAGGAVRFKGNGGFEPVTISNCAFLNNYAKRNGGALRITDTGCIVSVSNSSFVHNRSDMNGGAISFSTSKGTCRMLGFTPFRHERRDLKEVKNDLESEETNFEESQIRRQLIACPLRVSDSVFTKNHAASYGGVLQSNFPVCITRLEGQGNMAGACPEIATLDTNSSLPACSGI